MITIRVNDQALELDPGRLINLDFVSPIFYDGILPRAYTFPIRVPSSPHNRVVLGLAHRIDASIHDNPLGLNGSVLLGAAHIIRGQVTITDVSAASIELSIKQEAYVADGRTLLAALEETKLKDVAETVNCATALPIVAEWVYDVVGGLSSSAYAVRIATKTFFPTTSSGSPTILKIESLVAAINVDYPGYASSSPSDSDDYPISIRFKSLAVDDHLFSFTFESEESFIFVSHVSEGQRNQALQQAWLTRTRTIPADADVIVYPTIRWEAFYAGKNAEYLGWSNLHFQGVDPPLNVRQNNAGEWRNNYVPMLRLRRVLDRIWSALGLSHEGDYPTLSGSQMDQLLIWSNYATDNDHYNYYPQSEDSATIAKQYLNSGYAPTLDTRKLMPEMSAVELIEVLAGWYAFYLQVDGTHVTYRAKLSSIANPADFRDWTSRIHDDISYQPSVTQGVTLQWATLEEEGAVHDDQLLPLRLGAGSEIIEPAATPPFMITGFAPIGPNPDNLIFTSLRAPHTSSKGSNDIGLGLTTPPLRFVYYAGIAPAINIGAYPLATTETTDALGNPTSLNALAFEGETGLYNQHLRTIVELENRPTLDIPADLSTADLFDIIQWERSGVYFNHPRGSFRGIIRQIRISVRPGDTALRPAQVTLVKYD